MICKAEPVAILGRRTLDHTPIGYILWCKAPFDSVCVIHDPATGQVYFPDNGTVIPYTSIEETVSEAGTMFVIRP